MNRFVAALAVLVLVCGCMSPQKNIENSKKLRVGMTKEMVLEVMGEPLSESFCTPDLWYYYIESVWSDGLVTEDECMPLVFRNGRLVGFGRVFYNEYRLRKSNLPDVSLPNEK